VTLIKPLAALAAGVLLPVALAAPAAAAQVSASPDPAMPTFNGDVSDILYVGNTVYVGGTFTTATPATGSPVARGHGAAFDATTGQLTAWNPKTAGAIYDLASTPAGIAVGGTFAKASGQVHKNVAIVDPVTGAAAASFTGSVSSKVRALEYANDRLYVGGTFTSVDGQPRTGVAAYDYRASVSPPWSLSTWGPRLTGTTTVITIESAPGRIYLGGKFGGVNATPNSADLAAVDPGTGSTVTSWDPSVNYTVNDVEAGPAGVYAAADGPGGHLRALAVSDGHDLWDLTADGGYQAVTVFGPDIYFGGHFDNVCATTATGTHGTCTGGVMATRHKLGAVDTSGTLQPWAPVGNSPLGVHALENDASGHLGAGGTFDHINNRARSGFAQFDS